MLLKEHLRKHFISNLLSDRVVHMICNLTLATVPNCVNIYIFREEFGNNKLFQVIATNGYIY